MLYHFHIILFVTLIPSDIDFISWGHCYPCLRLLVTSAPGFKARVDFLLMTHQCTNILLNASRVQSAHITFSLVRVIDIDQPYIISGSRFSRTQCLTDSIRLGGAAHGIVTKTLYKTLPGSQKTGACLVISSQISSRLEEE